MKFSQIYRNIFFYAIRLRTSYFILHREIYKTCRNFNFSVTIDIYLISKKTGAVDADFFVKDRMVSGVRILPGSDR